MREMNQAISVGAGLIVVCTGADESDIYPVKFYVELDDEITQFREAFNRNIGSVRLSLVVDPSCSDRLRGMDDLDDDILGKIVNRRLQTFVVHVPVIGATSTDIPSAGMLLQTANVRRYWLASGNSGREPAKAVGLKRGDDLVYDWDVLAIYGPEAVWIGAGPPRPHPVMPQLNELKGIAEFAWLDSELFSREANRHRRSLPSTSSGPQ